MVKKHQKGERWSREEMILVLNLYFKLPFMKCRASTPEVKHLSEITGISNNSIAIRLSNFASCDPFLQNRGIKGMNAHIKQCQPYWDEFFNNREALLFESERILAEYEGTNIETKFATDIGTIPKDFKGETKIREIKARVNQNAFRQIVLSNYNNKCALTNIDLPELLVASHIIPWSENESERLNPANGICLSSLFDKAFDSGLISFQNSGEIMFSQRLKSNVGKRYFTDYFEPVRGKCLTPPQKYELNPHFLEWHRDMVFDKK